MFFYPQEDRSIFLNRWKPARGFGEANYLTRPAWEWETGLNISSSLSDPGAGETPPALLNHPYSWRGEKHEEET